MAANIIPIHQEDILIEKLKEGDRYAQKIIYDQYAGKMLSICKYYISDLHYAEDVMIKGFFKAFTNIESFQGKSCFYTWLRRLMSNECIDFLRSKNQKLNFAAWDDNYEHAILDDTDPYELNFLEKLIDNLPDGCRVVFNLYVVEEMKHKDIAEKLNISIGTSKSQLSYAKKHLQQALKLHTNG
ncbi:MAG: RNA polymerase sigma factor [Weeksellaceae bacterium]